MRCSAEAWEIQTSFISEMLLSGLYSTRFSLPVSMTYLQLGMVMDVSAMFVLSTTYFFTATFVTTRRRFVLTSNTRFCSCVLSAP